MYKWEGQRCIEVEGRHHRNRRYDCEWSWKGMNRTEYHRQEDFDGASSHICRYLLWAVDHKGCSSKI